MSFDSFNLGDIVYLDFRGKYMPEGDDAIYMIRGIRRCATCTQMIFEPPNSGGWVIGFVWQYEPELIVSLAHGYNEKVLVVPYSESYKPWFGKRWKQSENWHTGTITIDGHRPQIV